MKNWKGWQYLKEWRTYWYAFFVEFLLGRGDIIVCFRRGDYRGVVGNFIAAVLYVPFVVLFRYLYHTYKKNI